LIFLGVLTPLMVLPGVCNSPSRASVANRLPGVLATPETSITYWGFQKPPLMLGIPKTPANAWGYENPY